MEPKTFRFTATKDISNQLRNIELGFGMKAIDMFIIKSQVLGNYLYESKFYTISAVDYKNGLESFFEKNNININIMPINNDKLFMFPITIHEPVTMIEHKPRKKEKEND
jgi:hypothetical protein